MEGAFFFFFIAGRKSGRTERGLATGEKVGVGSKEEKHVRSIHQVTVPLIEVTQHNQYSQCVIIFS